MSLCIKLFAASAAKAEVHSVLVVTAVAATAPNENKGNKTSAVAKLIENAV